MLFKLGHIGRSVCLLVLVVCFTGCGSSPSDPPSQSGASQNGTIEKFFSLMNAGKKYLDQGDAENALAIYREAVMLVPNDLGVHLNLANCYLLSDAGAEAVREADEVLSLEPNSAAAYFIKGSAYLRLLNPKESVKALENSRRIDPGVTATFFQLGMARMGLEQWDEAVSAFEEGIRLDSNRLHSAARFLLAKSLLRAGRTEEAKLELQLHQIDIDREGPAMGAGVFERCKHTRSRVPFRLDQPESEGISIKFVDATEEVFGDAAQKFSGPIGLTDVNRTGWNSLFLVEQGAGFRLLLNSNGVFRPHGLTYPANPDAAYSKILVGDLQNDRLDDLVVLGGDGSRLFRMGTNGLATDVSSSSGLSTLGAINGLLIDLDFTGKLDLVAVAGNSNEVQVLRQSGRTVGIGLQTMSFTNITGMSGVPATLSNVQAVVMEDWNRDNVMDVIANRADRPPLLLEKQRGGKLVPREQNRWVEGSAFCAGDFDNDLRPDLAVVGEGSISICFNGGEQREITVAGGEVFSQLVSVDYDNDGWLDLWAVGEKIRVWRNLGLSGFQEQTVPLGLGSYSDGAVSEIHFADFDRDCDSDVIIALASGGVRFLRNEGGNANLQVKVKMFGNRSNASGIGCRIEIEAGGLRLMRTVERLPVEVGVGKNRKLDSFVVHWFNWPQGSAEVTVNCQEPLFAMELTIQEGSCPYLYAWDGEKYRFITDFLGAAPLGLPMAEGRYIEADPEELVWIGDEQSFLAKEGGYKLKITEELREVLYLDEAKLVVVDHKPGVEVHPTDKLLPGKPYPPGALMTLHREHPLRRAESIEGQEVTSALRTMDGRRVSPPRLRPSHLRGLAEPHGWILDYGPLDVSKPLVLVMNGWLRFGGGMANIAASLDSSLPFPFPTLEAEVSPGNWTALDVTVGAPAGKTKTILVDLEGKLAAGTSRLRLTGAFEIHWDRIALMEKKPDSQTRIHYIQPSEADLQFRGFSAVQKLPPDWPITPDYDRVTANSHWTITPGGWCTRYGSVSELIAERDEGLVIMNSGDELTLSFTASSLPSKPSGSVRDFFLYSDGWDKDSDFHVAAGAQVEPLPFHGMNDQHYTQVKRPPFPSDALHRQYNTRWVEGKGLRQTAVSQPKPSNKSIIK
ncbi:MAG: FG-GAP-like repeat-containing protein [Nitrospinaceae bacterium]|jgi:Tfp pilus assembly protein PilF|nr:FG-GAP-like repeat-containing protein [Nitrospinaceae bacterium]